MGNFLSYICRKENKLLLEDVVESLLKDFPPNFLIGADFYYNHKRVSSNQLRIIELKINLENKIKETAGIRKLTRL